MLHDDSEKSTVPNIVQSPPLSSPPVSLTKSWSLATSLKKFYIENSRIRNYFKKYIQIFFFSLGMIQQSSSYFLEKFPHQLTFASSH